MAETDAATVVKNVRQKYPKEYGGLSDEQIRTGLAKKHPAAYGYLAREAAAPAKPPEGPDAVGRAKEALVKEPPMGSHTGVSRALFGEKIGSWDTPGRVVRAAGDLFLPGSASEAARFAATMPIGGGMVSGPLMRTGAGALAGGVTKTLQSGDWREGLAEAGREGLAQAGGEVLPGALRFGLTQKAGQRAMAGRTAELEARNRFGGKTAHDVGMDKAVGTLEKQNYERDVAARRAKEAAGIRDARAAHADTATTAKRTHAEAVAKQKADHAAAVKAAEDAHATNVRTYEQSGAQSIAEAYKQQVPAFKDFPSNEQGLLGMVFGEGQQRMSRRFDAAMKDIVEAGRGKPVNIRIDDAKALGLPTDQIIQSADRALPDLARVDAGQLAERATGFKDHGVYRRVVNVLDKADIGDPAMRGEYRAGQALIQFADKSGMLKGEKFNPTKAREAFTSLKKIDELRKRGQGDIFKGPIAEAVRRPAPELTLPAEPAPLTPPVTPAFRRPASLPEVPEPAKRVIQPTTEPSPIPEGVDVKTLPKVKHGYAIGALLGELPALVGALATGHMDYRAAGIGGMLGTVGAGALSGKPVVTRATISPAGKFATRVLPSLEAQEIMKTWKDQ